MAADPLRRTVHAARANPPGEQRPGGPGGSARRRRDGAGLPPRTLETELLAACARTTLDEAARARLEAALATGPDWPFVVRAAAIHGILPLVARHLASSDRPLAPAAVAAELRRRHAASAQQGLALTAALVEALRALAEAGIEAVPFKGPLLAAAVYGDVGLRPFRDVDILVRPSELAAAVAALRPLGWEVLPGQGRLSSRLRCAWVSDLLLARGDALLELHWRLTQPFFGIADTLDDLRADLAPAAIGGAATATLAPDALLLYLCVHGATHRWARLGWICDVAELLCAGAPEDPEALWRRARAAGAGRMLALGVRLAGDLLAAPAPSVLAEPAAHPCVGALATAVVRHLPDENPDHHPGLRLARFHLAMRERLRDRARYAAAVLAAPSPADLEAVPLPPPLYLLHYVLRPLRLASAHAGALLRGRRQPPA